MLHEALRVNDLDELAAAARDHRVQTVRGFGPKSEAAILTAIDAHRRRPQSIRLIDAREAATALAEFVAGRPGVLTAEVAGGVRLWDEVVDELAVVATAGADAPPAAEMIAAYPPLARIEDRGADRIAGRLADGVRVRLRVTPPAHLGIALIEETGPPAHLERLRARSTERGLDWNRLAAPDESALYQMLGLPFIPPEARGWAELPSASDLVGLVTADDLRGLVHCHTSYSDGHDSVSDMARCLTWRAQRRPAERTT
jgi:DNA polymerase (family 10)